MYSFKPEEKRKMIEEIQCFLSQEHDLDLGIIAAENVYDFFLEMLGDRIYNMGLDDAKKFYKKYADSMDDEYYTLYKNVR